jgi:hypothetical protein
VNYIREFIIEILAIVVIVSAITFYSYVVGYGRGQEKGYKDALDDIRLGKIPRYKLVQTAEKWVEVKH